MATAARASPTPAFGPAAESVRATLTPSGRDPVAARSGPDRAAPASRRSRERSSLPRWPPSPLPGRPARRSVDPDWRDRRRPPTRPRAPRPARSRQRRRAEDARRRWRERAGRGARGRVGGRRRSRQSGSTDRRAGRPGSGDGGQRGSELLSRDRRDAGAARSGPDRAATGSRPDGVSVARTDSAAGPKAGVGLARAAVAIGLVTVAARVVGLGRTVVLARTVGTTCLGDTYLTANTVPNIVFEIVAGGALASLVVPVLAGPVQVGDSAAARRTASALLTWAVLLLTPLAVAGALLARPVMSVLVGGQVGGQPVGGCDRTAQVAVGARMLLVFAPQVVLYGVGIVLTGVLQAHRRFLGPALAPLLSSLVVIAAYLAYAAQGGAGEKLASLPPGQELTLSVGTTLGVAALSLSLLVPLRRTGLRLRPELRFPPGVAVRVRRLALAGAAALAAQQVSVAVGLRLANGGPGGSVIVYALATTVFLLPWAVLAVPLAPTAWE